MRAFACGHVLRAPRALHQIRICDAARRVEFYPAIDIHDVFRDIGERCGALDRDTRDRAAVPALGVGESRIGSTFIADFGAAYQRRLEYPGALHGAARARRRRVRVDFRE
ncbi:hypothetical protein D3C86_1906150 [compost metagenome]